MVAHYVGCANNVKTVGKRKENCEKQKSMVIKMKIYVCPKCDEEARFHGLCRDCTEYDSEGNVINAVRREELGKHIHDENCGHNHGHFHQPTAEMFRQRRRPKLTKKQMSKYQQILTDNNFTEGTVDEARNILLNHEGGEEE